MKRHLLTLSLVLASTCLLGSGMQAQQLRDHFKVPFAFHVGQAVLPAGDYVVQTGLSYQMLQNIETGHRIFAGWAPTMTGEAKARLIFHKTGDSYFLKELWNNQGTGSSAPASKQERELRMSASVRQVEASMLTVLASR